MTSEILATFHCPANLPETYECRHVLERIDHPAPWVYSVELIAPDGTGYERRETKHFAPHRRRAAEAWFLNACQSWISNDEYWRPIA